MTPLKRKYRLDDPEARAVFAFTPYYFLILRSGYEDIHALRNIFSRLGINAYLVTYLVLAALLLADLLVTNHHVWQSLLLLLFVGNLLLDAWANLEPLHIVQRLESEHFQVELLVQTDNLTMAERIARLAAAGRHKEADRVSHAARLLSKHGGDNHLQWTTGVLMREVATGRSWRVLWSAGEDYDAFLTSQRSAGPVSPSFVLGVFQELRDRRLNSTQQARVWQRLLRRGCRILPAGGEHPPLLPDTGDLLA